MEVVILNLPIGGGGLGSGHKWLGFHFIIGKQKACEMLSACQQICRMVYVSNVYLRMPRSVFHK